MFFTLNKISATRKAINLLQSCKAQGAVTHGITFDSWRSGGRGPGGLVSLWSYSHTLLQMSMATNEGPQMDHFWGGGGSFVGGLVGCLIYPHPFL